MMIKLSDAKIMDESSAGGSIIHRVEDDSSVTGFDAPD